MKNRRTGNIKGFTLVELLVTLAIIGILAVSSMVSLVRARVLAREARAKADVKSLRDAVNLLASDTGKWPGGCPIGNISNPEIDFATAQAGVKQVPTVGVVDTGCFWTAQDVANWKGPYVQYTQDPWGRPFYFDPDYVPWQNCASKTNLPQMPVVVSGGPNKSGVNAYDCDDIFLPLR